MQSMNNMKKEQKEQVSKEKIYVDSNAFIYAAIDNEEIGRKARALITDIKNGKYKAYTSTLTIDEFLWRVQKEVGRELASESVTIFSTLANLELINVDVKVIIKAIEIYKTEKLDPRDSIHLAAMKEKDVFIIISMDHDFDKIRNIKRVDFTL